MSKTTFAILFASITLIIAATLLGASFVAGGGGVVLTVAIIYAFVVTKREIERGDHAAQSSVLPAD